ncbi:unnamed protein product [Gongylonema pulchrum]|uniref:Uncharacterized protein n=1 Tax=Gongylonema pulchrum TaxID=637853 RepID=A0A3P6QEM2_9BILA|nr:unnamed protein product [Gongylonema pulchrum]
MVWALNFDLVTSNNNVHFSGQRPNVPLPAPPITEAPSTAPAFEIDADSIGTEFVFIFPGNSGGNASRLPEISVDLVNPSSTNVTVQILKKKGLIPIQQNIEIQPHSVVKYQFDASTYAKLCVGNDSFVRCPDTSIAIQSSDPISVVAHNYISGVAGDSYTGL